MSNSVSMSVKLFCVIFILRVNVFVVSAEGVDEKTCLMDSICKNKDKEGANKNSPCHKIHAPYDNVTDDDFYDLLWNNCPHFFDDKGIQYSHISIIVL